jgi:hypothetical protein
MQLARSYSLGAIPLDFIAFDRWGGGMAGERHCGSSAAQPSGNHLEHDHREHDHRESDPLPLPYRIAAFRR